MSKNATENEPFFLVMAMAWPLLGSTPEVAPKLVNAYVAARVLHYFFYMIVRRQPWRAFAWTASAVINMTMAYHIYQTVS